MSEALPAAAPADPAAPVVPDPNVTATELKPERTFSQAELDAAIEKRLAKERRKRTEIETRLKVTEELALKSKTPEPKPEPKTEGEPKRDAYDSYELFIEAKAEWRADQAVEKRLAKNREQEETTRTAREQNERAEAFKKRTKELAKDLTDFDEVMAEATSDPDAPVSRLFAEPINECDNPAAILYHLAKNPEEAERIASLPGQKQAREIWALEAKLKAEPPQKKPSKAPDPIKPGGGGSGPIAEVPSDKMPINDWMRLERERMRKKQT